MGDYMNYHQKLALARQQFIQFSKGVREPITCNHSKAIIQEICRQPPSGTEVEELLYDADKACNNEIFIKQFKSLMKYLLKKERNPDASPDEDEEQGEGAAVEHSSPRRDEAASEAVLPDEEEVKQRWADYGKSLLALGLAGVVVNPQTIIKLAEEHKVLEK